MLEIKTFKMRKSSAARAQRRENSTVNFRLVSPSDARALLSFRQTSEIKEKKSYSRWTMENILKFYSSHEMHMQALKRCHPKMQHISQH